MPRSSRTIPTSEISESEQSLDQRIYKELVDHVVEVETDAFIRAVLYKDTETMEEDRLRVAEYLTLSQTPSPHEGRAEGDPADSSPPHPTIPPPTTSHPTESTPDRRPSTPDVSPHQKLLLPTCYLREGDMYAQYVKLLNSRFFRAKIKAVDNAWLPAQPPQDDDAIPTASQSAGPPLHRVFRDTHKESRSFSRYNYGEAGLKPDLCLLIECGDTPNESEESEGKPKVAPHWKDVLVPIGVKKKQCMDMSALVQMAQYARSVMLEQFDRNFVITVLITGHECRVFHWDVVRAHVTLPFPTHSALFIQVMGRLATMTPSELGYDTQFSNAGRVRSTEIEHIQTHLTIRLSKPRAFFDHNATSSTPESSENGPSLVVDLENILFESKGLLFNRATRVWRAVAVNDPLPEAECQWSKGNTYIVKQNWADDKRPNEGFIHTLAQKVDVVPKLVGIEERQFTSSFRARFQKEHFLDFEPPEKAKGSRKSASRTRSIPRGYASHTYDHASTGVCDKGVGDEDVASNVGAGDEKRPFERVLLRFVFDGVGRPLSEVGDSVELLQATEQWITGLIKLDESGIIHRDISYGNLLLPSSRDGTGQASIIDFGLSHLKDENILTQLLSDRSPKGYILGDSQPHGHVTGTLPFVAHELLSKFEKKKGCMHALHHDIESVFWVLLYICLKEHQDEDNVFGKILRALTSHEVHQVEREKRALLNPEDEDDRFENVGKFGELEDFLNKFVQIRKACGGKNAGDLASKVLDLISTELQTIKSNRVNRKDLDTPDPDVSAPATKKAKHPKAP
ncbi:hypothetical protein FRC01_002194 [Tulasnella sp. 417]|nr:hypothetical protein FRC01_002194 [Tulasnella sp. 417]